MDCFFKQDDEKWKILSKKNLKQIYLNNKIHDSFYEKSKNMEVKLKIQIEELKRKTKELEEKLYQEGLKLPSKNYIQIEAKGWRGKQFENEKEFFRKVVGYLVIWRDGESKKVYKLIDGKYYEVGIRIPSTEENSFDEENAFFKITEVKL
jgi:hypothetical protein